MDNKKTSVFANSMIWFGAAVSIAEILTGTLIAPLGFKKGLLAIISGHIIGCILLYLAGLIGAKTNKTAMETVKMSFGQKGSLIFSVLNVLQLVGWTAVMIIGGAKAAEAVGNPILGLSGSTIWCVIICALIIVWILIGIKNLSTVNMIAMGLLFILTVILSGVVFKGNAAGTISGSMTFGEAVELSAAMPISWLPLIADYIKDAKNPKKSVLASSITYFFASSWMYIIGFAAAIFTGESDIAGIIMKAGLGIAGILIIILSTVTTTFMDAYSSGVSYKSIVSRANEKTVAFIVTVVGTLLAIFTPIEQFENFLYLIGSVFAPMTAVMISDMFILKKEYSLKSVSVKNIILWVTGFFIYRIFMNINTPLGNTLPVMIITVLLCVIADKLFGGKNDRERKNA